MTRGKQEAGSWIRTGQLENRPASWKLDKLEISGQVRELEIIQKLLILASPPQAGENRCLQVQHHATRQ